MRRGMDNTVAGRISPYATTTSTSGRASETESNPWPARMVSVSSSGRRRVRAAVATGVAAGSLPRPAGRGARVTTRTSSCRDAARAPSEGTDQPALPTNTMRSGADPSPDRPATGSLRGRGRRGARARGVQLEVAVFGERGPPILLGEAVDVEHPVQVVRLVLEDAREEALGLDGHGRARQVEAVDSGSQRPDRRPVHPRDGETPLFLVLLAAQQGDHGVRDRAGPGAVAGIVDEQPERESHLV